MCTTERDPINSDYDAFKKTVTVLIKQPEPDELKMSARQQDQSVFENVTYWVGRGEKMRLVPSTNTPHLPCSWPLWMLQPMHWPLT